MLNTHRKPQRTIYRRASVKLRRLFLERLETRSLLAVVTATAPPADAHGAGADSDITVTFDQPLDAATVNMDSLVVHAMQSGRLGPSASIVAAGTGVVVNPADDFHPGELVQATVTSGILDESAQPATPHVWQFRVAPSGGGGLLGEGHTFGGQQSMSVALGDLDGDGDLDAFVANRNSANRVLFNDGGQLSNSGQSLGDHDSFSVALGDLDGDGDLDAFVANLAMGNRVWLNDGGVFSDSGQLLGNFSSLDVALGDLDGDGDLDAFVANGLQANVVWSNDDGVFTATGLLGNSSSNAVALGDFDSDGDLDAFVANSYQPNRIWLNVGGSFADSGQSLGLASSRDVAVGDLDGDGDADAYVANSNQPDRIWFNDAGVFTDSGQELGIAASFAVALGDLDADGDLDAFVANSLQGNQVWRNDAAMFSDSGQLLGNGQSYGATLGDLDGDGDLDAAVANWGQNRVWQNLNPTFSVAPRSQALAEGNAGLSSVEFVVTRAFDARGAASVDFAFVTSGANPAQLDDFDGGTLPAGTLSFADGESSMTVSIDVVGDTDVELDEQFALMLSNPQGNGAVLGHASGEAVIRNDDGADLGDLPFPFPTILADNGPAHVATGPTLGAARDVDEDGLPSVDANGDDLVGTPDDEDGITFATTITAGQLQAEVTVNASEPALLDAWVDFNGDHSFDGAQEQVLFSQAVAAGDNLLTFAVPAGARPGSAYARFRLSSAGGLAPRGGAADGEVEDQTLAIANPTGSGVFGDSQQSLGNHSSLAVELGDLDGDGDLDAFVANGYEEGNGVWWNESGLFTDSGQILGQRSSADVALGDLDGDGDLDAFVANNGPDQVWWNNAGAFTVGGQELGSGQSQSVGLGDLDGDGDLDAFVAHADQGNRIWLNQGDGTFTANGQSLGNHASRGVALGDLDGDGDLDAFVTNYDQANRVWRNEGGWFVDDGQQLGDHRSWGVALGDVDGDGDLDALITNVDQDARLWHNQSGQFSDSNQRLGDHFGFSVSLGDLDGDGDLDAMIANGDAGNPLAASSGNRVLLNSGGVFSDFGQPLGDHVSFGIALGDLDGDGDLDAFSANYYQAAAVPLRTAQGNRVWLNLQGETLLSVRAAAAELAEGDSGATAFEFEVIRIGDVSQAGSVNYAVAGGGQNPADADDFGGAFPSGVVEFAVGESRQMVSVNVNADTSVELDEHFLVTLSDPQPAGSQVLAATAAGTIINDDLFPLTLFLTVDNAGIVENLGVATFTAQLSSAANEDVVVDFALSGTAVADEDYQVSATQLVIPAGETSAEITVTAIQDDILEDAETVIVEITSVTNAVMGNQQQQTTIEDDDAPPRLYVASLLVSDSDVTAHLSARVAENLLNLYDAERSGAGPADVTIVGAVSGPVSGSLVISPSGSSVTFIRSGGPFPPDTYTVTLRGAADGFVSDRGLLLDGNNDGTAGDDFESQFLVSPRVANAATVAIPDFARGPGQPVDVPATAAGLPVTISGGAGVRSIDLRLDFNSQLLQIDSVALGPDAPAGSIVQLSTAFGGATVISFTSPADLTAELSTFATIQASVPAAAAPGIYNDTHILELHLVTVQDGNGNRLPVIQDNAIHVATFFGEVSGNARLNASDAARVARIAALLDSGYAGALLLDPKLVGDVSGNGRINSGDASLVAQAASLLSVPEIPDIPANGVAAGLASSLLGSRWTTPDAVAAQREAPLPPLASGDGEQPVVQGTLEIADQALDGYLLEESTGDEDDAAEELAAALAEIFASGI